MMKTRDGQFRLLASSLRRPLCSGPQIPAAASRGGDRTGARRCISCSALAVIQRRNAGRRVWEEGSSRLHRSMPRRSSGERGAIRRGAAPRGSRCKRSLRKCAIPHSSDWYIVLDLFCQVSHIGGALTAQGVGPIPGRQTDRRRQGLP